MLNNFHQGIPSDNVAYSVMTIFSSYNLRQEMDSVVQTVKKKLNIILSGGIFPTNSNSFIYILIPSCPVVWLFIPLKFPQNL